MVQLCIVNCGSIYLSILALFAPTTAGTKKRRTRAIDVAKKKRAIFILIENIYAGWNECALMVATVRKCLYINPTSKV